MLLCTKGKRIKIWSPKFAFTKSVHFGEINVILVH